MKKLLTMMLLLAATMGFYSCSSDDDDDNPVMELTSENITGSWYRETDDEYVEYYFDAFGNGSYYYESDKDYESYRFSYQIEDDKIVIVESFDGGTYSYKIAELRKNSVIIEIEDRTFTFVRDYDDDDDYDDGDDNPVMELTSENITGSWYWETDDEYVAYYFDAFGNGRYYYESDKDYESYDFHYNIEDDKIVIEKNFDGTTYSHKIAELRKNSLIIEIKDRTFTFVREYDDDDDYDDGDDDDDDYDDIENIPADRPEPVPPTGEGTKIIGTWCNPTFISSSDPEDWEDNVVSNSNTAFTFNEDGTAYFYDEDPEDSFEFIYEYKHNENTLMMYCGRYGQIVSKRTIVFEHDNKMIMRDDYYFDPAEDAVPEYSDLTYSLNRLQ